MKYFNTWHSWMYVKCNYEKRCPNSFWWGFSPLFKHPISSIYSIDRHIVLFRAPTQPQSALQHTGRSRSDYFQHWKFFPILVNCKTAVNISCREIHRSRRVFGVRIAPKISEESSINLFFTIREIQKTVPEIISRKFHTVDYNQLLSTILDYCEMISSDNEKKSESEKTCSKSQRKQLTN